MHATWTRVVLRYVKNPIFDDRVFAAWIFASLVLFVGSYVWGIGIIALLFPLLFPFILFVRITRNNFLLALPIIVSLNFLFAICSLTLINLFGLPVSIDSLLIIDFAASLLSLAVKKKSRWNLLQERLGSPNLTVILFIYGLFAIALGSRVLSVAHTIVPILHDPVAHAYYAKLIIDEHAINYFYSPGLHIWVAMLNEATGLSIARGVNLLTNVLSASAVMLWGLSVYAVTRKKILSIVTAFLVLIIPMPAVLYYLAGKNAFIATTPFIGLLMLATYTYLKKPDIKHSALILLLIAGIGTLHYPTFAFVFATAAFTLLVSSWKRETSLRHNISRSVIILAPLCVSLIFIGGVLYNGKKAETAIPLIQSSANTAEFHRTAETTGKIDTSILDRTEGGKPTGVTVENPLGSTLRFVREAFTFTRMTTHSTGVLIVGVGLVAIYFVLNNLLPSKKRPDYITIFSLSLVASSVVIAICLSSLRSTALETTLETAILLVFLTLLLPTALLIQRITKLHYVTFGVLLLLVGLYAGHQIYKTYDTKSHSTFVNSYDMSAYSWINQHLTSKDGIVGMSQIDPHRSAVIFSIDGSLWIPIFTNNTIATPFQELRFSSRESNINYEYLHLLQSPDKDSQKRAANYFISHGYTYLYIDGASGATAMGLDQLITNGIAKPVYTNPEVTLAQLLR